MPSSVYRTSDLVLASVLHLEGMEVELELDDSSGRVRFVLIDPEGEDLTSIARDVIACKMKVEPLSFARSMGEVRRLMYRFLEEHGRRAPRQPATA